MRTEEGLCASTRDLVRSCAVPPTSRLCRSGLPCVRTCQPTLGTPPRPSMLWWVCAPSKPVASARWRDRDLHRACRDRRRSPDASEWVGAAVVAYALRHLSGVFARTLVRTYSQPSWGFASDTSASYLSYRVPSAIATSPVSRGTPWSAPHCSCRPLRAPRPPTDGEHPRPGADDGGRGDRPCRCRHGDPREGPHNGGDVTCCRVDQVCRNGGENCRTYDGRDRDCHGGGIVRCCSQGRAGRRQHPRRWRRSPSPCTRLLGCEQQPVYPALCRGRGQRREHDTEHH